VPVREPPSRPEATVVSIELNETQVVLEGQSFELEEVGARLQELGAEVHVVIAAGAGTSHDRVRELIDQLRAHGIQRFAIRMAEPPE